jgi:integrase
MKVITYKPAGRESWYFHLHGKHVPTPSRQIRRGGFKTEAEAQREGRKIAKAIDDGTFVARNAETIAGFLTAWMEYKTPTLKPSAAESYANSVRVHLVPNLGQRRVQDLRPEHVAAMIGEMLATGRSDRRGGLSPKSVRNHVGVLHAALDDAVRWGRVQRNVVDVVQLPRWERAEPRTWTSAQMRAFLAATAASRDAAAWRLVLSTGIRRGELAALRWRHVELDRGEVRIETSRVKAGSRTVEGSPKSKSSRRTLPLDRSTTDTLRRWKGQQARERLAAGEAWCGSVDRDDDFVVADEIGRPLAPNTITRHWTKAVLNSGLPIIRLHDGRHSYATVALNEAGQHPRVVQERLGHSVVATTLGLYVHVTDDAHRRAADAVAALLD